MFILSERQCKSDTIQQQKTARSSTIRGSLYRGSLSEGGLCPGGGGLCPGREVGVSVHRGPCPKVSVEGESLSTGVLCPQGFSVQGFSVRRGSLSRGLHPGGSMPRGVSVRKSLFRGVSVHELSLLKGTSRPTPTHPPPSWTE